jgi:inosine/xanthosine triphosphatase
MKISLGTTSIDKRNILINVLETRGIEYYLEFYKVESDIPEQPLSEALTAMGAKNRAKAAYEVNNKADIGLGMEAGLELIDGTYFFIAVVAIFDAKDNSFFLGYSSKLQLPGIVDKAIKEGEEFGLAIRNFASNEKNSKKILSGTVHELVSRKESFTQAINNAFNTFLAKENYITN